ncbi:MAG TPA: FG-GAP-like repeat-containing protein, partial [Bryobacteraceae bacterium]|nr:FG-GAP-like repeat-containing protein [Bryobacteraceae bacterium]
IVLLHGTAGWSGSLEDAAAAIASGDYERAAKLARDAAAASPRSAKPWKLLGMAFAARQDFGSAAEPFRRACELDASEENACYYHGRNQYALGQLLESERAFRRALAHSRPTPRTLTGLALTLEGQGQFEAAESRHRAAIRSGDREARRHFGMFLYRQGRLNESLTELRAAGATDELKQVETALADAPRSPEASAVATSPIVVHKLDLPMTSKTGGYGRKHLPETMMGGLAVIDYNADGRPDLYVTNGASLPSLQKPDASFSNRLFRNNPDGSWTDVTAGSGLVGSGYDMGAAAGDFDGDGRSDIYVTGVRGGTLYRNLGDGRFQDVTKKSGLDTNNQWSVSAGWFDYSGDGWLDLFVVHYVAWDPASEPSCGGAEPAARTYCHPRLYAPLANSLYRNNGRGGFDDVSEESGISAHLGKGMGLAIADFDGDALLDVFVPNDTLPNLLFRNSQSGTFKEVAMEAGVAMIDDGRPISSMGADFGDIDNDGRGDLFITALTDETFPLFRNLGKGEFRDITAASRVGSLSLPWSGWGLAMVDLDNDGDRDVVAANGHVMDNAELTSSRQSKQPVAVFRNMQRNTFSLQILQGSSFHRGLAVADFDLDGRVDVAVTRLNEAPQVLMNRTDTRNHWVGFRLRGTKSNRSGIGATITVSTPRGKQWAAVMPTKGYASSSEATVHFGLGTETSFGAEIRWPSGCRQELSDVEVDRHNIVPEGSCRQEIR